jgi:ribosomal protein S18 acetylase RimI-like enzyme
MKNEPAKARDVMNIAPATLGDALGIASVQVRSWQAAYVNILSSEFLAGLSIEQRTARWQDILQKQESQTLVAHQADGIAGFVSFGHWRDENANERLGEIWALYAKPQVWGSGVGRALLEAAVQELRAIGRRSVLLWVLSKNDRGIRFYESSGFKAVPGSSKLFELGGRQVEEICLRLEPDAAPSAETTSKGGRQRRPF